MAQVMAQGSQSNTVPVIALGLHVLEWCIPKASIECASSQVHDAEGMVVPGVRGPRKRQVRKTQLPNPPKTLDERVINNHGL